MIHRLTILGILLFALVVESDPLDVGIAGHAFDHLGGFPDQGETAAACGANLIYTDGVGGLGYSGLPPQIELDRAKLSITEYLNRARGAGIQYAIGYVCATSIVKLDQFDHHWSPAFRAQFSHPPSQWLQLDQAGHRLPSWYGGDYRPACMNNPDWRAYERAIVRLQLEAGCDGIFFDNPTVHPQGCYCEFCLRHFAESLGSEKTNQPIKELRKLALARPSEFAQFRATIARDFLSEMRTFARTIHPHAWITANNSLNSSDAFFSQIRTYGYDLHEMSKAEDFVVVEDMNSQPRMLSGGPVVEYGPTYELLHAVTHKKPVVAVTIAEGDYRTPPNLTRLAMAEAVAHGASYLSWPTWPQADRASMVAALRPEANLLRENARLFTHAAKRRDVLLFFPWRQWIAGGECRPARLAAGLSSRNIQFDAVCEDQLVQELDSPQKSPVLLVESPHVLTKDENEAVEHFKLIGGKVISGEQADWLDLLSKNFTPSISLGSPASVRAVVQDLPSATVLHLLNLNVQRLSSVQDRVTPAENVEVSVRAPLRPVHHVNALTADSGATTGQLEFSSIRVGDGLVVKFKIARLTLSTIVVIE